MVKDGRTWPRRLRTSVAGWVTFVLFSQQGGTGDAERYFAFVGCERRFGAGKMIYNLLHISIIWCRL